MTRQVMIACRQSAINAPPIPHWVLPKFSKTEMTKIFGVKRLTCFTLDFSKMSDSSKVQEARDGIETMLKEYGSDPAEKPDLTKFRYADDSMFIGQSNSHELRRTILKRWNIELNHRSKSTWVSWARGVCLPMECEKNKNSKLRGHGNYQNHKWSQKIWNIGVYRR